MSLAGGISSMRQALFPTKPSVMESSVPDLTDKVTIVTGSNTGLGKEIAKILYSKNATVYLMARSESKTISAIQDKTSHPRSNGSLHYIHLDLADITTIRTTVDTFLARESRLHLLFNNAGVGYPEKGSETKQGYELQLGVNCIGPFGLTKMLEPTLNATAKSAPSGSVRVVWMSSSAAEGVAVKGFVGALDTLASKGSVNQYFMSKLGNYLHASEFAERNQSGVRSVSINPGNLDSELWRTQGPVMSWLLRHTVLYPVIYGAYTALFAAFSPEATVDAVGAHGAHVAPWGKVWNVNKEMRNATKSKAEGGSGIASEFWEWTETQWKPYF